MQIRQVYARMLPGFRMLKAETKRAWKTGYQMVSAVSPNAPDIRALVKKTGIRELSGALKEFHSLLEGRDPAKFKLVFDLPMKYAVRDEKKGAMRTQSERFGEYLFELFCGDREKALEIKADILGSPQYMLTKEATDKFLGIVPFIRSTNAFDVDRISKNLPVVVVFGGDVLADYKFTKPQEVVFVRDERFEAVTAIYGNHKLPSSIVSKGGVRFVPFEQRFKKAKDGTLERDEHGELIDLRRSMLFTAADLARSMNDKNPFWDVLFDGGKTVIIETRPGNKKGIITSWVKAVTIAGILGKKYVAGPDMEMSPADMELMVEVYNKTLATYGLSGLFPTTGMSVGKGGFPHKEWMVTGTGVAESFFVYRNMLPAEERAKLNTVLIQGFGDVGGSLVRILHRDAPDVKIVGVSDITAAIYDPEGLDGEVLSRMAEEEMAVKDYLVQGGRFSAKGKFLDNIDALPFQEAKVFMPAARNNVITEQNVNGLKVRLIVEGANNSVKTEIENSLYERKERIVLIPGPAANGGGIFTSTEEMLHSYFDGRERLINNSADYQRHIVDSVRELAFVSIRSLIRKSQEEGISPYQQLRIWTEKLREEVYRLTEIIARIDKGDITTQEFNEGTKNALLEIYRRIRLGHGRIPGDFGTKFAILATVREMLSWKELYKLEDVLGWLKSEDESDRREAAYILGRLKLNTSDVVIALADALIDESPRVRKNAVESLGQLRIAETFKKELTVISESDKDPMVRLNAKWVLSKQGMF